MAIRRITVAFIDPDGLPRALVTGPMDHQTELIRRARAELELYRANARREGDPRADADYRMSIVEAPASIAWQPGQR